MSHAESPVALQHLNLINRRWIEVGSGHSLHLAEYGNPQGPVVLFLHGGPGAGCVAEDAALFDTRIWRVLLLDQRGAGLSRPQGCLTDNSFQHLIEDMERVRQVLGIESWCLAGGSFGATLGLTYSGLYPRRVVAQLYWGVFIPSLAGMAWLYGPEGAAAYFPEEYQAFSEGIPIKGWLPLVFESFHHAFHHSRPAVAEHALRRWLDWELALAYPGNSLIGPLDWRSRALAQIELHYAKGQYFTAEPLLRQAMGQITAPTRIYQGERDWVCPLSIASAYAPLSCRIGAGFELIQVADAFHSSADLRLQRALCAGANWMLGARHP